MVRVFIAIPIDEQTRHELVSVQSLLLSTGAKLKLVEPENLHLTLKFLGEVGEEKIGEIEEALKKTMLGVKKFKMEVKGLGAFPGFRYLRVLWAGINQGKNEVIELQRKIDFSLQPLGFRPERNFHPHVTIARVKFVRNREELITFIKDAANKKFGAVGVRRIDLMKSTLTRSGPVYTTLSEIELETDCET